MRMDQYIPNREMTEEDEEELLRHSEYEEYLQHHPGSYEDQNEDM